MRRLQKIVTIDMAQLGERPFLDIRFVVCEVVTVPFVESIGRTSTMAPETNSSPAQDSKPSTGDVDVE